jgi:hypothetical protein
LKGPWRRCPVRGYAGRCAIPGTAVRDAGLSDLEAELEA